MQLLTMNSIKEFYMERSLMTEDYICRRQSIFKDSIMPMQSNTWTPQSHFFAFDDLIRPARAR